MKTPDKSEYIQPALMATASTLNVIGNLWAIAMGQDKGINPLFYISLTTSSAYILANVVKVGQIYQARSFVERENNKEKCLDIV